VGVPVGVPGVPMGGVLACWVGVLESPQATGENPTP
jgi:hypothetical protein